MDRLEAFCITAVALLVAAVIVIPTLAGVDYARVHHRYIRDQYVACMHAAADYPSFAKCNDNYYQ